MQEEISALNKNCTWEFIPKPKDDDLVTCKWVYKSGKKKNKKKADDKIDRFKALLVARGSLSNMVLITMKLLALLIKWQ